MWDWDWSLDTNEKCVQMLADDGASNPGFKPMSKVTEVQNREYQCPKKMVTCHNINSGGFRILP